VRAPLSRLSLVAATVLGTLLAGTGPALAHTAGVQVSIIDDQANACPGSRVLAADFTDIGTSPFQRQINCIWDYAITTGVDATHYAPEQSVLRMQMAVYIWNFLDGMGVAPTDDRSHGFTDVDSMPNCAPSDASCPWTTIKSAINSLANAGVVKGFDSTHFRPGDVVYRDQMATFINSAQTYIDTQLSRSDGRRGYATTNDYFDDDDSDVHQANINAIASAGITGGVSTTNPYVYDPGAPVLRGQMAAFLARDLEANIRDFNLATSVFGQDQTYIVRPGGDAHAATGQSIPVSVYVSPGAAGPTQAALLPCGSVHNGAQTGDPYADTFTDANNDGRADGLGSTDTGAATFGGGARTQAVTVSDNTVSLSVTSGAADCALVVVFNDSNGDGQLNLDGNKQASEPFAATAELSFG
jgi:hypothetical protein